ncbi:hypothetical protein TNCV_3029451 [Trichonephila clavipes]|nr:hypothetical protein TNCV_3029451 [Trichonephila clavipes]
MFRKFLHIEILPRDPAKYTAGHRKCNTKKDERLLNKIYFVDNMLTKYQMIKFIDFCEVWFLQESVARVTAIVGDNRCHTPVVIAGPGGEQ